jgi:hypothetical protein
MISTRLASAGKIFLKDPRPTLVMLSLAIAAMTALCLSVIVLPLADYPNHLARLYIQSHIAMTHSWAATTGCSGTSSQTCRWKWFRSC